MEHETYYELMMEALDGELDDERADDLQVHLQICSSCLREWQAVQAIDALFRQTPALSPMVGFTQRTLARLPDRRYRVWMISAMYLFLLISGLVPLAVVAWVVSRYGATLIQPGVVRMVLESFGRSLQVIGAVIGAVLNGMGEWMAQQPAVVGWLLVMAGFVSVWAGVYRQLVGIPVWNLSQVSSHRG